MRSPLDSATSRSVSFTRLVIARYLDGVCICVIRYQDLSAAQLLTHTVWLIADAAEKGVKPRSPDEHGACSVLQMAYDKGKEIHLFISSGSGLISDQASGTSYQMQRGLNLISSEKLGKGKSSAFKRIVFLQPAIPSIPMPTERERMPRPSKVP